MRHPPIDSKGRWSDDYVKYLMDRPPPQMDLRLAIAVMCATAILGFIGGILWA